MAVPAPPASTQATAPADKKSKRLYIYWSGALALLLAVGLFCSLIVVPTWRTRTVLAELLRRGSFTEEEMRTAIEQLGGPERAADRISFYMRLPCRTKDLGIRETGVSVLEDCGEPAIPVLEGLREDFDPKIRLYARMALQEIRAREKRDWTLEGAIKARGESRDGRPHDGAFYDWWTTDQKALVTYKKGKRHGAAISWYENGQRRWQGAYDNDVPAGTWRHWDAKGNLVAAGTYRNGKPWVGTFIERFQPPTKYEDGVRQEPER
jgi:hypothetical protein